MMFFYIQQMDTLKKSKLNYEQSMLQMKKLSIHEQINAAQERTEQLTSAFTTITNGTSNQATSIFNSKVNTSNAVLTNAQNAYNEAKNQGLTGDDLKFYEDQLTQAKSDSKTSQQQAYTEYQRQMTTVSALTQSFKKIQEAEEKAKLKELNKQEDRIELRLNEIKSELTMIDTELQSAEQTASERAQKLAPKYA